MIRKIISTTATRFIAAIISFTIIILNSRFLGPSNVGLIGIIILDITIITTISSVFGGPSLVYFVPRKSIKSLTVISIFSSFTGVLIVLIVLCMCKVLSINTQTLIPEGFINHVLILSFLQSFLSNNINLLLGKEKIYWQNILSLFQIFTLIIILIYRYYLLHDITINSWLFAFYFSIIIPLLFSLIFLLKIIIKDISIFSFDIKFFAELSKFGLILQLASLTQLFNYRLPYYFLNAFFPAGVRLGIFTVGTQVSEGILIIGKSVSMVQYARISNIENTHENGSMTVQLLKFTVLITSIILGSLLLIPDRYYSYIFYFQSFKEVRTVLLYLAPGIIALSANMILSHFLSGIGKPKHNLQVSIAGLFVISFFSYILIPQYGIVGAAISTSFSYLASAFCSLFLFNKYYKLKTKELIFNKSDIIVVKNFIKSFTKGK